MKNSDFNPVDASSDPRIVQLAERLFGPKESGWQYISITLEVNKKTPVLFRGVRVRVVDRNAEEEVDERFLRSHELDKLLKVLK